jgi:NADPH:quinone reductase-like Zn-dependent oxidoreductase
MRRFRANAKDLFDAIAAGHVKVQIGARFPLADVARAHEAPKAGRPPARSCCCLSDLSGFAA